MTPSTWNFGFEVACIQLWNWVQFCLFNLYIIKMVQKLFFLNQWRVALTYRLPRFCDPQFTVYLMCGTQEVCLSSFCRLHASHPCVDVLLLASVRLSSAVLTGVFLRIFISHHYFTSALRQHHVKPLISREVHFSCTIHASFDSRWSVIPSGCCKGLECSTATRLERAFSFLLPARTEDRSVLKEASWSFR